MSNPVDDLGRYKIVMPYDVLGESCGSFASWDYSRDPRRIELRNLSVMDTPAGRRFDAWWRVVSPQTREPQTLVVERLNEAKRLVERWSVRDAIPVRFVAATSSGKDVAAETLEIAHQGFKKIK
jgi:hypothetical protein